MLHIIFFVFNIFNENHLILSGCKANQPIYQVAQLRLRPNLNLEDVTNITNVSTYEESIIRLINL